MHGRHLDAPAQSAENVKAILWGIAGLMVFIGGLIVIGTLQQPTETNAHTGVLLDATASRGARGYHNNTTLIIQNESGTIERYELGSTIRVGRISEIRQRARTHKGANVVYQTIDHRHGRLVSVETLDGTSIVSPQYTLAAVQFGGWVSIIFGIILAIAGSYYARQHRSA